MVLIMSLALVDYKAEQFFQLVQVMANFSTFFLTNFAVLLDFGLFGLLRFGRLEFLLFFWFIFYHLMVRLL